MDSFCKKQENLKEAEAKKKKAVRVWDFQGSKNRFLKITGAISRGAPEISRSLSFEPLDKVLSKYFENFWYINFKILKSSFGQTLRKNKNNLPLEMTENVWMNNIIYMPKWGRFHVNISPPPPGRFPGEHSRASGMLHHHLHISLSEFLDKDSNRAKIRRGASYSRRFFIIISTSTHFIFYKNKVYKNIRLGFWLENNRPIV